MTSGSSNNPTLHAAWIAGDSRLPDFINEIEDGYFQTDLRGSFTFVNDALCRITGYSRDELIDNANRRYHRHTDSATADQLKAAFNQVYVTGQAISSMEMPLIHSDGHTRYIDISATLIIDSSNQPCGFRGFVRDITERRQIESALRSRVAMLSLLQQVDTELASQPEPDGVLTVGMNAAIAMSHADSGYIALVEGGSLRIARAVGTEPDRKLDPGSGVIGRVLEEWQLIFLPNAHEAPEYHGDTSGVAAAIAAPLIARDRVVGVLLLETRQAGQFTHDVVEHIRLLTARLAAALDNALLLHTSQTQLAALQKLYTHVSDLERLKTDMIRIAAHDMRAPLAIIASYLLMLREELADHLNADHQSYFEAIDRSIERMNRLSTDVLSLERISERQQAPAIPVEFDRITREVAAGFLIEARERMLDYVMEIPDLSVMVLGDATDLGEAVSNLISNAIKYTPDGGSVTVRVSIYDQRVVLEVIDTGYGVPEADQKRLFQPFSRVRTHETVRIAGTGLGLHLVKKIVERHGGAILFQSQVGVGSLFGFVLPLAGAVPPPSIRTNHAITGGPG